MADNLTGYAKMVYDIDREAENLHEAFDQGFIADNCERVGKYGNSTRFSEKQQKHIRRIAAQHLGDHYVAECLGQQTLF